MRHFQRLGLIHTWPLSPRRSTCLSIIGLELFSLPHNYTALVSDERSRSPNGPAAVAAAAAPAKRERLIGCCANLLVAIPAPLPAVVQSCRWKVNSCCSVIAQPEREFYSHFGETHLTSVSLGGNVEPPLAFVEVQLL